MNEKILVIYKSVTGFTKEYAEWIAQETGAALMDIKKVTPEIMSGFDTVVFGGRMHAGRIDGLKTAKQLLSQSHVAHFLIFATGAMPNDAKITISEMWHNNLTPEELSEFPHFYMQAGLRYEKMPFLDRIMMKAFSAMMRKKKDKNETDRQLERAIAGSYDISSKEYIAPLIAALK